GLGLFLVEEGKFRLVEFFQELAPGEHIQRLSLGSKSGRKIPGSARLFVSSTADGFAPRASAQWRMVSGSCLTLALDMSFSFMMLGKRPAAGVPAAGFASQCQSRLTL